MATSLKLGDRCIIIHSEAGNEGKIVEVTGYTGMETFSQWSCPFWYDVFIRSLGEPLRVLHRATGAVEGTEQEGPFYSAWLRKLPDVKEDVPELVELQPS